jgi:tetratricopeptide (TPR) repeat protein
MGRFESLYYQLVISGDYQAVVDLAMSTHVSPSAGDDVPWIVAGFTLLGRTQEAIGIFQSNEWNSSVTATIIARCFLALAFSREARHEKARKLLLENARESRKLKDTLANFFCSLGFAFYRYTEGRFIQARSWSEKALNAASREKFTYGMAVTHELLGQIHMSSGHSPSGSRNFEFAQRDALRLGHRSLHKVFDLNYDSILNSFGVERDGSNLLLKLELNLHHENFQDDYSQTLINLGLVRLYSLRGELRNAKKHLDSAGRLVYGIDSPVLVMDYNLQLANLLKNEGELEQALSIIRAVKPRVMGQADLRSQLKILGFEADILKRLDCLPQRELLMADISRLTHKCGQPIAFRYLNRNGCETKSGALAGEDMLGDLIDSAHAGREGVICEIIDKNWLSLLPIALRMESCQQVIYFDAMPCATTIIDRGEIIHIKKSYTKSFLILMSCLSEQSCSKEALAARILNQPYNPLRHDGLIYGLVARARKRLGAARDWIEMHDSCYRLKAGVKVLNLPSQATEVSMTPLGAGDFVDESELEKPKLNPRQMQMIQDLNRRQKLAPKALRTIFDVSDATILRDLNALVELGYAKRIHRGRASRYISGSHQLNRQQA